MIRCEDALTQDLPNGTPLQTPLIVNPPSSLPTSTQPLFNAVAAGATAVPRTQKSYGRYENQRPMSA